MSDEKTPLPPRPEQPVFDLPLPVDNINDALPNLRRPFAPSAVKWKPQATWPKNGPAEGAIFVGYIDARLVAARLNKVVGGNWSETPKRIEGQANALMYELKVFDQTHVDIGIGQGQDAEMKLKAVHSDALKRPAVRFGIGESLYAMPEIRMTVTEDGAERSDGTPTIKRLKDGKLPSYLPERIYAYLRERYEAWLKAEGEAAFGPVLDHGDASTGSVGYEDPAAEADDDQQKDTAAPLQDDKAKELCEQARKLRDEIRALDDGALPAQSFDAAMAQREHSHERLEDFVGNLTELLADVRRFEDLRGELAAKLDDADLKKVVGQAQRRASRRERVEVLEKALAATEGGDDA